MSIQDFGPAVRYETPQLRLKALYQGPMICAPRRVLAVTVDGEDNLVNESWGASELINLRLAFEGGSMLLGGTEISQVLKETGRADWDLPFDAVLMHCVLERFPFERRHSILRQFVCGARIGGLVVGCTTNGHSPRVWVPLLRKSGPGIKVFRNLPIGVFRLEKALRSAGLERVRVFSLLPSVDNPRSIVSIDREMSVHAFARELEVSRDGFSRASYWLRRAAVLLALNRLVEPALFFWGYRRC